MGSRNSNKTTIMKMSAHADFNQFSPKPKVFFVCRGNTCRSAMAMLVAQKIIEENGLPFEADSFGVCAWSGGKSWSEGIKAAAREGLDLTKHRTCDKEDLVEYDKHVERAYAIFCMEQWQREEILKEVAPDYSNLNDQNVRMLVEGFDVEDPVGDGIDHYHNLCRWFFPIIKGLLNRLADQYRQEILGLETEGFNPDQMPDVSKPPTPPSLKVHYTYPYSSSGEYSNEEEFGEGHLVWVPIS